MIRSAEKVVVTTKQYVPYCHRIHNSNYQSYSQDTVHCILAGLSWCIYSSLRSRTFRGDTVVTVS